jgi:hypothetical protein
LYSGVEIGTASASLMAVFITATASGSPLTNTSSL